MMLTLPILFKQFTTQLQSNVRVFLANALAQQIKIDYCMHTFRGELAEWLRSGLQIRLYQFDSGTRLQMYGPRLNFFTMTMNNA